MKKKRRVNIILYFIFMIFMFLLFDFASSIIPSLLNTSIQGTKYGIYFTSELFWLILVIVVIYLAKNSYVFSEKKESFINTILIGTPIFLFSILYFLINVKYLASADKYTAISLILYSITIGLTEEFMCRGWILNEFLERYGDKRKYVILSIVFSALIFGGMHISNIWVGGQTISETLIQILFATSAGIFFGSLYYRTRNLWAMAFLHGFYDFSLLINDLQYIKDCTSNQTSFNYNMYSLAINGCLSIILLLSAFVIIRKSKTYSYLDEEISDEEINSSNKFKKIAIFACVVLFLFANNIPYKMFGVKDSELHNHETCYLYEEIKLGYVEMSNNNKEFFDFAINNKEYLFDKKDNKVTLTINDGINKIEVIIVNEKIDKFDVIEVDVMLLLIYAKQGSISRGTTIYYNTLEKNKNYSKEDLEKLRNSFTKYELPSLVLVGKLKTEEDNYYYPAFKDYMGNLFIINKDNRLKKVILSTNKTNIIIEKQKEIDKEKIKMGEKLLNSVPFLKYKYYEYNDAYRGISTNIDNISEETLLANIYDNSKQEKLDIPIYSDICYNMNPCIGEIYVSKEEVSNKLKSMYNKDTLTKTAFAYQKGLVELKDNYYVYIATQERDSIKRISKIININSNNNELIIEEKAAFISKTIISKFSNIEESVIEDLKSEEESVYKNYFESNQDKFATFKHKFILNPDTNTYYYVETTTN